MFSCGLPFYNLLGFFVACQVVSQVVTVTFVVVLEACGQIDLYMRLLTWLKWQHSLDVHWSSSEKFCLLMLMSQITYTHTLCTCHWPRSGHISFVSMRSNPWKDLFVNANTINANLKSTACPVCRWPTSGHVKVKAWYQSTRVGLNVPPILN